MQATTAMLRLRSLDRGQRLNEIDLGISGEVIATVMHKGIRSTGSLFEVVSANPSEFARKHNLTEDQLDALLKRLEAACEDCLMAPAYREELVALDFPLDHEDDALDGSNDIHALSNDELMVAQNFSAPSTLEVSLLSEGLSIRDQGRRGTCVAFATIRSLEVRIKSENSMTDSIDLSEHFLYWNTKENICPSRNAPGTKIYHAIKSLADYGICDESQCPYEATTTDPGQKGSRPSAEAFRHAENRKHLPSTRLQSNDLAALKTAIANGSAVVFSIPVFSQWYGDPLVRDNGILYGQMGANDRLAGNHAIALVGYFEDTESPDESYFLFDNSWGARWAASCHYGPGRGILPFSYVTDHCVGRDAFILN